MKNTNVSIRVVVDTSKAVQSITEAQMLTARHQASWDFRVDGSDENPYKADDPLWHCYNDEFQLLADEGAVENTP